MTARITTLIDKLDTFELVRDKIALILAEESAQQQVLAAATEGKDPEDWRLRVYIERSNPWDILQTDSGEAPTDRAPVVNVAFDTMSADAKGSQTVDKQQMRVVINIDVLGIGVTRVVDGGQIAGDESAARMAQRGLRLVRNILMSDSYTALGFDRSLGLVGQRAIQTVQAYQPEFNNQNASQIVGARLTLHVDTSETSPQTDAVVLEGIDVIIEAPDGQVLARASFDTTED